MLIERVVLKNQKTKQKSPQKTSNPKIGRLKLSQAWSECSVPLRFFGLGDKVLFRLPRFRGCPPAGWGTLPKEIPEQQAQVEMQKQALVMIQRFL